MLNCLLILSECAILFLLQMKKLFNYRPIVLFCLVLIFSIIISAYANVSVAAKIVLVGVFGLVLLSFIVLASLPQTRDFAKRHASKFIVVIVAISIGTLSMFLQFSKLAKREVNKSTYEVFARICSSLSTDNYGNCGFDADTVSYMVDNKESKLDGKVRVTIYKTGGNNFDAKMGDYIKITGTFSSIDKSLANDFDKNYVARGIYYKAYANSRNVLNFNTNKLHFDENIRLSAQKLLNQNMTKDNASVAYSMLFGDTSGVSEDILQDFRDSGVAHLLAVSGLHLGFLVALLSFICKICKANKYFEFFFIVISMLLYSYVCGFTNSVTRALVMTTVLLYSKLRYKEYDSLNSIALSAVIILIINPLRLFNAGFQLSFFAVLGIILLSKPLEDCFAKIFNKKIAQTLAVMVAVQLGVSVPILRFFENFSLLSMVTNIIAIPIASFGFVAVLVSLVIATILPFMGFLLTGTQYIIGLIITLCNTVSSVPFAVIKAKYKNASLALTTLVLVTCSDYVFIKNNKKIIITSLLVGALCIILLV